MGAQPPSPEWGAMLARGREFLRNEWWIATFPGIFIAITVLGFNLLGDGLRDALDPRALR
jgi:peptide/nickel transport system permease protein